jgi:HD-GYP domain-containing protein (c-di-GMP phosphodiesterase class II)
MWASEEAFRVYGMERATPWLPLEVAQACVLPEYRPSLDDALQRLVQGVGEYDEEFEIRRVDNGEVRFVHSRAELILTDAGGPETVVGAVQDITERKAAEREALEATARLRRAVDGTVLAMGQVVETREPYTAGHERRVSELATAIAVEMGITGEQLTGVRLGGLIHDVGKIAVPAEILAKPGRLTEVEFSLIKQHAQAGYDILAAIDFGWPAAEMALQHHERLDGSGYPRALRAADILLEAKILAVADVVEAMSSHRPYRATLGMPAALAEIREHAGLKFDAGVVAACVRVVEEHGFLFAT